MEGVVAISAGTKRIEKAGGLLPRRFLFGRHFLNGANQPTKSPDACALHSPAARSPSLLLSSSSSSPFPLAAASGSLTNGLSRITFMLLGLSHEEIMWIHSGSNSSRSARHARAKHANPAQPNQTIPTIQHAFQKGSPFTPAPRALSPPPQTTPHRTAPHRTTPQRTTQRDTTPHHITPHHATPHSVHATAHTSTHTHPEVRGASHM